MVKVALNGDTWAAFSFSSSWMLLVFGGAATGTLLGGGAGNRFFPFWRGREWHDGKGRKTGEKINKTELIFPKHHINSSVFTLARFTWNEASVESDGNEDKCELPQKYQMRLIWTRSNLGFRSPDLETLDSPVKSIKTSKQEETNEQLVLKTISGSFMFHFNVRS